MYIEVINLRRSSKAKAVLLLTLSKSIRKAGLHELFFAVLERMSKFRKKKGDMGYLLFSPSSEV